MSLEARAHQKNPQTITENLDIWKSDKKIIKRSAYDKGKRCTRWEPVYFNSDIGKVIFGDMSALVLIQPQDTHRDSSIEGVLERRQLV